MSGTKGGSANYVYKFLNFNRLRFIICFPATEFEKETGTSGEPLTQRVAPEKKKAFMLGITIPTLAPIFLIILLGWWLRTRKIMPEDFFSGLNTLTFYIGLPALLMVNIATSPFLPGPALRIFYVLIATTGVITLLAYPLARLFRLGVQGTGSFIQAAMRSNVAYIGLPVLFFALADAPLGTDVAGIRASAMLVLASSVPVYNFAGILILARCNSTSKKQPTFWELTGKVATNPLLVASLIGLFLNMTGAGLPLTLVRTLEPLGQMALPLALLSIGASFTRCNLGCLLPPALGASLLKVAATPLLGFFIAQWFGLPPMETLMALIFLACPTAISSYIMAEQMGADADLAGTTVIISTLLSIIPLAVILQLTL